MKAFLAENSVFIKTTAVGLAILVLVFSLPFSAKAVDTSDYTTLSNQPFPADSSWGSDNRVFIGKNASGKSAYYCEAPADTYGFVFTVDGQNRLCFCSPRSFGASLRLSASATSGGYGINSSNYPKDSETQLYYFQFTGNGDSDAIPVSQINLPIFNSLSQGLSAVRSQIDNPGGGGGSETEQVSTLNYSLPPGNVAFVKLPDEISLFQGVTLRTQMPETNLLYSPNGQLWNSSQRTGFSDSLPTADFDLSQFSLINWAKDGETTVLGLTQNAIYNRGPLLIGNEYMVIVNPIYYGGTANGPYEFLVNGSVQINAVGVKGISVYALDSSIGFTSQGGLTVPTEVIGDPFGGEIDAETGEITWTDPTGGSDAPSEGGNNLIPTSETVFDAVKRIANDFANFLKGPINAIRTVLSAISNFVTEFKSLYIWLPGPVYNLITSAIMVALTIGVVKIFV